MIPFNRPPITGQERRFVLESLNNPKLSGDGPYGKLCEQWFEKQLGCTRALLTPSCTHSLELAALLIDIKAGDEVIMPSYTFVSTANAFALRGARIVFVDIRHDTQNIDETLITAAITSQTKAIVPVHYAGIPCAMDTIMKAAEDHGLYVIEDAAQAIFSKQNGRYAGTIGHIGAFSFHETKNLTSGGEGGLTLINDASLQERAEIIREKGTDRSQFFRGMIDKYSWVDLGSSYLLNDLSAAFLWGQIQASDEITSRRLAIFNRYQREFAPLAHRQRITLPTIPDDCSVNGHMFYMKLPNTTQRDLLLTHLASAGIMAVFHYVPLHSSRAGRLYGRFHGVDRHTTATSETIVRLPLFFNLSDDEQSAVINAVMDFFQ